MTCANVNYKLNGNFYQLYYNGDHYPVGLLHCFGLQALCYRLQFHTFNECKDKNKKFTKKLLEDYIKLFYPDTKFSERKSPIIEGDTDYNYIVDFDDEKITAYSWDKLIFEGDFIDFLIFAEEKKCPTAKK